VSAEGYALLGLTAVVAVVVGVMTFAVLRFAAAARDNRRTLRDDGGGEWDFLKSAAAERAVERIGAMADEQFSRARWHLPECAECALGFSVMGEAGGFQREPGNGDPGT
jgi:hypothetical protein